MVDDADEITDEERPRALVDMFTSEIFEGEYGYELRDKILDILLEKGESDPNSYKTIRHIWEGSSAAKKNIVEDVKKKFQKDKPTTSAQLVECLKDHQRYPWRPGGPYAARFVSELRLPRIFAGIRSSGRRERKLEVVPKSEMKPLQNYQKNMQKQIENILNGSDEGTRAIVTLPTGAGKTRVVVEAIVQFLNKNGIEKNILWIAQSDEVCEQAVACFRQIWEQYGRGGTLNIFRAWGDNDIPTADEQGIIVAGIQKLHSNKSMENLNWIYEKEMLKAVFIDEAHHSTAPSYMDVLNRLEITPFLEEGSYRMNDKVPLIGLTATPERTDGSETKDLIAMYGKKRIYPTAKFKPARDSEGKLFGDEWKDIRFMKERLTKFKFLADAKFHGIEPGRKFVMNERESKDQARGGEKYVSRIATEVERNQNIKKTIIRWAKKGKKILYFGTNVSQSNAMAKLLEKADIKSVCITADTRYAARKLYIDSFNDRDSGDVQVMCNYNVLATGFDAPKIDVVIIARPTTSVVAYQQMVGRGLRGEVFGGNEGNRCDIVTVKDNIYKFNNQRLDLGWRLYDKEVDDRSVWVDEEDERDAD